MVPVSWLLWRYKVCRLRLLSSVGMGPVSRLLLRYNRYRVLEMGPVPSSGGMAPVSRLLERSNDKYGVRGREELRLLSSVGMLPASWLLERFKFRSVGRLPSAGGMVPVSWLSLRRNSTRVLEMGPVTSAGGMGPVSLLSWRSNSCRLERLPSAVGMLPVSWLL